MITTVGNEALRGKSVLITGGSRGLGHEMALAFANAGARVAVVSRNVESCQRTVDEIIAAGGEAIAIGCHLGEWDALEPLVETVIDAFGSIDVLVNNAGMSPMYESLTDVTEALFDKVIAVNLRGPFRLTALVGEHMVDRGSGSIINVSSMAAVRPTPIDLPYGAAKSGLNTLTMGFAQALGPAVRVNAIMCGPFLTDVSKAWDMDAVNAKLARYPLQRAGRPEEIVGAALFFASDASSYVTGTILPLDGGMTATR